LIHPLGHHDSNRFAPFSLQVNEKAQVTQVDKNLTGQLWDRPSFSVVCQPDQGSHFDRSCEWQTTKSEGLPRVLAEVKYG